MSELTWRLGLGETARAVIVTADDLGLCHAANLGVREAMASGAASSASLLVPAPWSREAAARYRGEDVGVLLSVTAEHELLRFGPITHSPSLLGGDGGFPAEALDALDHADLDEARRECRAQLERAILLGFKVTHLAAHRGALVARPEFFDIVLELASEYRLPLRLPSGPIERSLGFPARQLAAQEGVVVPDRVIDTTGTGLRSLLPELAGLLDDGVSELVVRPAADTDELRAFAEDAALRADDLQLLTREPTLRALLRDAGATLIGWQPLLELARRSPTAML
jgi:predicted glycoside hydrolase/deacetylase ChbG (UPF0249 family)